MVIVEMDIKLIFLCLGVFGCCNGDGNGIGGDGKVGGVGRR